MNLNYFAVKYRAAAEILNSPGASTIGNKKRASARHAHLAIRPIARRCGYHPQLAEVYPAARQRQEGHRCGACGGGGESGGRARPLMTHEAPQLTAQLLQTCLVETSVGDAGGGQINAKTAVQMAAEQITSPDGARGKTAAVDETK